MSLDQLVQEAVRGVVREEIRAALSELAIQPVAALELLNIEDVVKACSGKVTADRVRGWCRSGRLPARKVGRGYLVCASDLRTFLTTQPPPVPSAAPPADPQEEASRILTRVRGG